MHAQGGDGISENEDEQKEAGEECRMAGDTLWLPAS